MRAKKENERFDATRRHLLKSSAVAGAALAAGGLGCAATRVKSSMPLSIESRIQRLEDIEAIKQLKARYCSLCDDGYDADGLAELFTDEAIWDGGGFGVSVGREEIHEFFENTSAVMPFAVHMVMNPVIEIDGDTATGCWYLFQAATSKPADTALWGSARYDEEYVRVAGDWKFKSVRLTSRFWTPYAEGWEKRRSVYDPV